MLAAYKLYLKLTRGIVSEDELPDDLSDLPAMAELPHTVRDVELNEELRDIVKTRYVLYLGRGESLHLDRKLIHDVVEKIHNRQGIHRAAVKSLQAAPSPIECGSRERMLCWSALPCSKLARTSMERPAALPSQDFQPCAVLEGGNGFVDMPGLGDADAACEQQMLEGVQNAGVIFVVLRRSLADCKETLDLMREKDVMQRALRSGSILQRDAPKKVDVSSIHVL